MIHIRNPKSVKRIYTNIPFELNSFVNVEYLFLALYRRRMSNWGMGEEWRVYGFKSIKEDLINLNSLKSLYLSPSLRFSSVYSEFASDSLSFEDFKNDLKDVHRRKTAQGEDFRIYYEAVELLDLDKMDECKGNFFNDILKFQLENYDLLQDLPRSNCFGLVHFNSLMKFYANALPPRFFEKYATITQVDVTHEIDLKLLLEFLNSLHFLTYLFLDKDSVTNLNALIEQLNAPRLKTLYCPFDHKTDFKGELLFKFKELSNLIMRMQDFFEHDLAFRLFEKLKNLVYISFDHKEMAISIKKEHFINRFFVNFCCDQTYTKVCLGFDQIRTFCNLMERRNDPLYWIKSVGLISLRFGFDSLKLDHGKLDHLFNCNFTWYTDMLMNFINPELKSHKNHLGTWQDLYIGPSSELILKEQ